MVSSLLKRGFLGENGVIGVQFRGLEGLGGLLTESEEPLDGTEKAFRRSRRCKDFRLLGCQAGAAFRDDVTDGFSQIGVTFEQRFHRCMADFQDFGFFKRDDVGGPGLAGEKGHPNIDDP